MAYHNIAIRCSFHDISFIMRVARLGSMYASRTVNCDLARSGTPDLRDSQSPLLSY